MPYTLAKALVWMVLALVLGVGIGWLLRSVAAQRQISRARSQHADGSELERLRGRVAALESVVDDRERLAVENDRLAAELETIRSSGEGSAIGANSGPVTRAAVTTAARDAGVSSDGRQKPGPTSVDDTSAPNGPPPAIDAPTLDAPTLDLEAAAAELGHAIELDDLKVIEGIGPSIEDLCHGIGIRGWNELARTESSLLRTMLNDAGPRFKTQDPDTWPRQAALLASGRWVEFRELVDGIRSDVPSS